MLVDLKRPFDAGGKGFYKPEPGGTVLPDSLVDMLPNDAEVLEGPDNSTPVADPEAETRQTAFSSVMEREGKTGKKSQRVADSKQPEVPLSKMLPDEVKKPVAQTPAKRKAGLLDKD